MVCVVGVAEKSPENDVGRQPSEANAQFPAGARLRERARFRFSRDKPDATGELQEPQIRSVVVRRHRRGRQHGLGVVRAGGGGVRQAGRARDESRRGHDDRAAASVPFPEAVRIALPEAADTRHARTGAARAHDAATEDPGGARAREQRPARRVGGLVEFHETGTANRSPCPGDCQDVYQSGDFRDQSTEIGLFVERHSSAGHGRAAASSTADCQRHGGPLPRHAAQAQRAADPVQREGSRARERGGILDSRLPAAAGRRDKRKKTTSQRTGKACLRPPMKFSSNIVYCRAY